MKNQILLIVAAVLFVQISYAQEFSVPGGVVGTSSGPSNAWFSTGSGFAGFRLQETSGGAAQFRMQANVGSFVFDDIAGNTQGRFEFNGGSSQLNFINDAAGRVSFQTNGKILVFDGQGRLGVNTSVPQSELSVNGKIESEEIEVMTDVPDYVFTDEYEMLSLEEIEEHINTYGYLPNIQNQNDVDNNRGLVKLGALTISVMEKMEELTLHMIEMNKRVKALEAENKELKKALEATKEEEVKE